MKQIIIALSLITYFIIKLSIITIDHKLNAIIVYCDKFL